jgi:hypothetical protein
VKIWFQKLTAKFAKKRRKVRRVFILYIIIILIKTTFRFINPLPSWRILSVFAVTNECTKPSQKILSQRMKDINQLTCFQANGTMHQESVLISKKIFIFFTFVS